MKRFGSGRLLAGGWLAVWIGTCLPAAGTGQEPSGPSKVVVLGFDGADARLVEKWMEEGHLPHLERLSETGAYQRLLPTNPPQTPVSWSTFATGLDPGQTTIFDFLKRDPVTYFPDFAMISLEEEPFLKGKDNPMVLGLAAGLAVAILAFGLTALLTRRPLIALVVGLALGAGAFAGGRAFVAENIPVKKPKAVNNRQGMPFWAIAGQNGIRSTVIRVPATFPPDAYPNGRLLSGLGVPDIRGTFGTYSYYTSEIFTSDVDTEKGGKVVPLDVEPGVSSLESFIYGPFNKLFDDPPEIDIPLGLAFDWENKVVRATASGREIELTPGGWSDWVPLTFPINSLIKVKGMSRFHLISMEPELKLYMSAVNFDPTKPPFPISHPKGFARQIYDRIGYWKTLGWALDTWALDEHVIDEATFKDDMDYTVGKFEEILHEFLEDPADRLYVQIFYFTDRAGHMFWRLMEPDHPGYDAEIAADHKDTILDSYKRMDDIVGWTLDHMPEDATLLICSDHGFSSWQRSFNVNTWLWQNGFLALKGDQDVTQKTLDDLFVGGEFWPNVDWPRTQAYALGLGAIYINLLGRESEGIVPPGEEYERIREAIIQRMEAHVDTSTGLRPVSRVYRREEMYSQFDPDLIPDLRMGNSLGYRVSWQTSLGGIPKDLFEIHTDKWSADHCSLDPELVKGIFFANRPVLSDREPYIGDLCPTILELLGVPIPQGLSGQTIVLETAGAGSGAGESSPSLSGGAAGPAGGPLGGDPADVSEGPRKTKG